MIISSQTPLPDYTQHIHNRQTSVLPVGFEPATPASERPQIYALDHAATGIGCDVKYKSKYGKLFLFKFDLPANVKYLC